MKNPLQLFDWYREQRVNYCDYCIAQGLRTRSGFIIPIWLEIEFVETEPGYKPPGAHIFDTFHSRNGKRIYLCLENGCECSNMM